MADYPFHSPSYPSLCLQLMNWLISNWLISNWLIQQEKTEKFKNPRGFLLCLTLYDFSLGPLYMAHCISLCLQLMNWLIPNWLIQQEKTEKFKNLRSFLLCLTIYDFSLGPLYMAHCILLCLQLLNWLIPNWLMLGPLANLGLANSRAGDTER